MESIRKVSGRFFFSCSHFCSSRNSSKQPRFTGGALPATSGRRRVEKWIVRQALLILAKFRDWSLDSAERRKVPTNQGKSKGTPPNATPPPKKLGALSKFCKALTKRGWWWLPSWSRKSNALIFWGGGWHWGGGHPSIPMTVATPTKVKKNYWKWTPGAWSSNAPSLARIL